LFTIGSDPKLFRQEKAKYGTSPCMGINLGVEEEGAIRVGDPVYVIKAEIPSN